VHSGLCVIAIHAVDLQRADIAPAFTVSEVPVVLTANGFVQGAFPSGG
jgi:hypothetical protein